MPELPDVSQWLVYEARFIDPAEPRGLWFCDGPMSVWAIQINAVCLASTANWDDLPKCQEFIRLFPYVLIVCPDEDQREVMIQELRKRVDIPIVVSETKSFLGCKSVWDLKNVHGLKAVDRILLNTYELPAYGLLNLRDVTPPDIVNLPKVISGIQELDRVTGGFFQGDLSVWTGKQGSGKSTILSQLLLEAIDQSNTVCAYSGELPAWRFKYWAQLQAAGPEHVIMQSDKRTGRLVPTVPDHIAARIDEWWDKRFLLDDLDAEDAHDEDKILRNFEYAVRRYGAAVFLVDNIMTARFKTSRDADYYRAQSNFVRRLKAFAKRHNVHVHVVAHPRKEDSRRKSAKPEADDVGGSGDVTNLADNVFAMSEVSFKGEKGSGEAVRMLPAVAILKNRAFGDKKDVLLGFDRPSKRFFSYKTGTASKRFGWDLTGQQIALTLDEAPPEGDPFEKK